MVAEVPAVPELDSVDRLLEESRVPEVPAVPELHRADVLPGAVVSSLPEVDSVEDRLVPAALGLSKMEKRFFRALEVAVVFPEVAEVSGVTVAPDD